MKLINGDCLEEMDKLDKVDMILTDPPYGSTANKWDVDINIELLWETLNIITNPNTPIVVFGNEPFSSKMRMSNIKNYKYDWIWKKNLATAFLLAKKQPLRIYENIMVFYKKQCLYNPQMTQGKPYIKRNKHNSQTDSYGLKDGKITHKNTGERYPTNFLEFDKVYSKKSVHPTQKPVELLEYLIKTYTNEGDTVLDCYMGSGSTGVACLNTNRNFIGIELDTDYFNIARKRLDEVN